MRSAPKNTFEAIKIIRGAPPIGRARKGVLKPSVGSKVLRPHDFVNPPSISKKTIFYFLLNVAQKSGLFRSFPTLTPRLLEVIFVCRFRGIPIGYEAPRQSEPAGPLGWALLPFDNFQKCQRRQVKGIARSASCFGADRPAQLKFLRLSVLTDSTRLLERCLRMTKRDRQLFRTRVMYYDSPAEKTERFTPPPPRAPHGGSSMAADAEGPIGKERVFKIASP